MKKKRNILATIINWILGILIVVTIASSFLSITSLNKDNKKSLFGYNMYTVLSDSMKDTFAAGDIIVTKAVDVNTLEVGDIITFKSTSTISFGKIVSHKIRTVNLNNQGKAISFVTYGTTTDTNDEMPALASNIYGKYKFSIPKLGYFFQFLQTPAGYISLFFAPVGIMLVLQTITTVKLFKKYKIEKKEEVAEKIAKDNETAEELKRLKEELESLKKSKE